MTHGQLVPDMDVGSGAKRFESLVLMGADFVPLGAAGYIDQPGSPDLMRAAPPRAIPTRPHEPGGAVYFGSPVIIFF